MNETIKNPIGHAIMLPVMGWVLLVAVLLSFSVLPAKAEDPASAEAQELVNKARLSFQSLLRDPNMTWFRDHLKDAKGVLIVPQLLKAAFFVGGSGGSGVLLARNEKTREWSDPAFYTLGSGSFGLQFGAEASEAILLVMTPRGVEALLTSTLKLGGDVSSRLHAPRDYSPASRSREQWSRRGMTGTMPIMAKQSAPWTFL